MVLQQLGITECVISSDFPMSVCVRVCVANIVLLLNLIVDYKTIRQYVIMGKRISWISYKYKGNQKRSTIILLDSFIQIAFTTRQKERVKTQL